MNVIICGVVKNAGNKLEQNIEHALQLGKKCDSYKIVIYENNSTDDTKTILNSYAQHPNCVIISEDIADDVIKNNSKIWAYTAITGSDHPCRIEQISNARNRLIDEVKKDAYSEFNYVVMIDFDAKYFFKDGILHSLNLVKENRKRVIYANSTQYYDYYALRSKHSDFNLFGPELMGEHFWKIMNVHQLRLNTTDDLYSVYSAFNGIGVYDKNTFISYRFDCTITPQVKAVYNLIASQHHNVYEKYKPILQAECNKFSGGEKDDTFFWKNNSGYNKPVICEHVVINFAMFNDGYEICINPKMLFWW